MVNVSQVTHRFPCARIVGGGALTQAGRAEIRARGPPKRRTARAQL